MATKIAQNTNRAQFENLLNRWEARWRLRRIVLYLPRILMAALGLGIVATLIVGMFRVLAPMMMVTIITGAIVAITVIISSALGIFGKNGIEAARQFDKIFGLQERIATALELMEGRIKAAPELAELQVADAMNRAQDVDPRKHIKIEIKWLEWFGVVMLTIVLTLFLGLYALFAVPSGNGTSTATQTTIQQAADDVRDTMEDIATNSALTDEERSNLLDSLEVTLDDLSQDDASAEDSFVAMSELESDFSEMVNEILEEIGADQAALAAAAEALQNSSENSTNSNQSLSEAIEDAQEAIEAMTPEELAEMQQQLESAAAALEEQFPELAQELRELSENAASGLSINSDSFDGARDAAESAENSLQDRQDLADDLTDAAQLAQQNAEDIAQSENQQQQDGQQGQQMPNQDGQQGESQQADQDNQQGQQSQSQDGQQPSSQQGQGQPNQQGENGQPQSGDSDTAAESADPANANAAIPNQGDTPQTRDQTSQSDEGGVGSGAGDGDAQTRQDGLSDANQEGGNNQADGEGETAYQEIYAPNNLDVQGQDNIILEPDASDSPSIEGDFQDNPDGVASVPYDQVFRTYEDAANRALENDYVPLGMQDVVRDYFSSLQPTGE